MNIKIQVIGFGWSDLHMPWSRDGKHLSVHLLTTHLKKLLKAEKDRGIPEKPPTMLPGSKDLPVLGTKVPDLKMFEDKQSAHKETFVTSAKEAQQERVDEGLDDVCEFLQPTTMPQVDRDLVGKRLDVCCKCLLEEGGEVLRWCQGEVLSVSNGDNIVKPGKFKVCHKQGEAVMFQWDPIENRNENLCISS